MIYTVTFNPSVDYHIQLAQLKTGQLNRAGHTYFVAGGKAIMVSKMLANLNIPNVALGFLGGFTGEYILQYFKERNYAHDFTRIKDNTRVNVKLNCQGETELNAAGPNVTNEEMQAFLNGLNFLTAEDILIISGNIMSSIKDKMLKAILRLAEQKGFSFVLDSDGATLKDYIVHKPLLIKPNLKEFEDFLDVRMNSTEERINYGKKCLEMGAQFVILSLGKDGALFFDGDNAFFAPALSGEVIHTVGSGDSMLAGFIGKYNQGLPPLECFRYAVACAAATAFSEDIGSLQQVEQLLPQVIIEEIK